MYRRALLPTLAVTAALALAGGCASLQQLSAEVSTFGDWPAGRSGGSYAFDRLPSQQAQATAAQQLEDAAMPALARAGFTPAAAGSAPDVLVQVGARVSRADRAPWDDPLWWGGGAGWGAGHWRHGPWRGAGWGTGWGTGWGGIGWGGSIRLDSPRFEREVALLIRDRATGKPLFEARASSEGYQRQADALLQPLYAAALADFPRTGLPAHQVTVPLLAQ